MPARDIFHETVKRALLKAGWTITHDPLKITWGDGRLVVDLGAERVLGAEGDGVHVAVGSEDFAGLGDERGLARAVGWFVLHEAVLHRFEPGRALSLAVRRDKAREVLDDPLGRLMIENQRIRLLALDGAAEAIWRWIP